MAAPIQTLQLDVHYSITRETIAPTQRSFSGGGGVLLRRVYERPLYLFRLHASHEDRASAEAFYGFAAYHMGDIPFYWNGNAWGTVTNAQLVGFGTGSQTHFFLPHRNILSGPTMKVAGVTEAGFTLTASSGLIVFNSAPADQAIITAEAYTCRYKCVFWMDGDTLLSEELFYQALSRFEGITIREVVP
jgi:hypothetical protein